MTDYLRAIRPDEAPRFERRFETRPGEQAQAEFADEPGVVRKVHLFPFVLVGPTVRRDPNFRRFTGSERRVGMNALSPKYTRLVACFPH